METERTRLRQWTEKDLDPFHQINSDSRVMQFFPRSLSKAESDSMVTRLSEKIEKSGWGLWAVDRLDKEEFIGFVGLSEPSFSAHFTPCVEVGWRLKFDAWGHGFATEAAFRALEFAFESLHLPEVVSFTSKMNLRSIKVMERLGMHYEQKDEFDHPNINASHPLCRHVLYRLDFASWNTRKASSKP
ncbi:MAG: GNAT family N-acetyltransferase [SAR324 cluster bacterium]|uniref:GNAT family N-acetyltransferase n=1 Tax=SAR324 cluster bacterium TaxID=2024889 RepID=A0A7X9FPF8_9DELT|nr:GNAT family N-acetyltransferase [SAR324 cluster bacterium]